MTHDPYTVIFKEEWDSAPHIDYIDRDIEQENERTKITSRTCHVIRVKEKELLMDFFRRRSEGALLVSGERGVGKTSAITSAIITAHRILKQQKDDNKELVPVLINAPNFEIRKINRSYKSEYINFLDFKRLIMQNLVRGLYQRAEKHGIVEKEERKRLRNIELPINNKTAKKKNIFDWNITTTVQKANDLQINKLSEVDRIAIKNDISNLFMRAVARKVTEEAKLNEEALLKYRLEKAATFQIGWKSVINSVAVSISLAVIGALFLPLTGIPAIWAQVLPAVISIAPPTIAMSWQIKKSTTNESKAEQNAGIYYLFDYDLSTLQSELEETLRRLTRNHYKVIFVIDELDKMDEADVIEVMKSLKPLFNQGSALFVLISGKEFFDTLLEHDKVRGTEYTLFSQRIFLQRPRFEEIKKFMDYIVSSDDRQAVMKLFSWNEIEQTEKLHKFLKDNSINYGNLNDIKNAKIVKNGDTIVITVEDGNGPVGMKNGSYSVLIKNEERSQDSVLTIPLEDDRSTDYEFTVVKENGIPYICSRSKQYRDFEYYAMYASKSDFFDLYNVLRDNIFYIDGEINPKLNIELDEKQQTQAKLQEIMGKIYTAEEYGHPSEWYKNHRLLTLMYDLITKLAEPKNNARLIRIESKPFRIVLLNDNGDIVDHVP